MNIDTYISEINKKEGVNVLRIVESFEKKLLKCFRLYEDNTGYEDYKMNDLDYLILYTICKDNTSKYKITDYLVIMYSYYKLEEFYFPIDKFKISEQIFNPNELMKIVNIIKNFIYI